MSLFVKNIKIRTCKVNCLQPSNHNPDENLLAQLFPFKCRNNLHCQLLNQFCIHLAIHDNCNHDKFTANLWSFRNALDCLGKFNQFWRVKRSSYITDLNLWMEKMCFYWNHDPISNHFGSP